MNRDFRRYVCDKWIVDPKIRFIDRFKWNPPVIDEILRKLQVPRQLFVHFLNYCLLANGSTYHILDLWV